MRSGHLNDSSFWCLIKKTNRVVARVNATWPTVFPQVMAIAFFWKGRLRFSIKAFRQKRVYARPALIVRPDFQIKAFVEMSEQVGRVLADTKVSNYIRMVDSFFRWCNTHAI